MLSLSSLTRSNADYLTSDQAREVAEVTGDQVTRWLGRSAQVLDRKGAVVLEDLEMLYAGRIPGGTLLDRSRRSIVGWDLVFAAPKSASVIFSSSDHDVASAAVGAHERAVDAALAYLEDRALTMQRRRSDGAVLWPVGVAAARFTHGVSRSLDPHLHSHVCLPNIAQAVDGRFGALDGRGLYAHRSAADSLYRAVLRYDFTKTLGVEYASCASGLDRICGISRTRELAFSHRRNEMKQGRRDRDPKVSPSRRDVEDAWRRQEATAFDVAEASLTPAESLIDEYRFSSALETSGFRPREIVAALGNAAAGGMSRQAMEYAVKAWSTQAGRGIYEESLLRAAVIPSPSLLRVLGPRPTDLIALDRWERARLGVDRNDRSRSERYRARGLSDREFGSR